MSVGACTDEEIDEQPDELSEHTSSVVIDNRIALNRIALNRIALNRIAVNRIAVNGIIDISNASLLATPERRELLGFVVTCALPEGVTLRAPDPAGGPDFVFPGAIGLAPRWQQRSLTKVERRWVSACLLARVNHYGASVEISMRGPHEALDTTRDERNAFRLDEGAFYGDVFTETTGDLNAYACRGRAQAAGENGALVNRDCTEPDPANPGKTICGMNFAGDCADFTRPANAYACKKFDDGYYNKCGRTALFGRGGRDDNDDDDENDDEDDRPRKFRQVVTVFVRP